jgi:diguanylate cyclase (GGDEF)-like protein
MFDLDHFKRVNDGWGHPVGDAVLKELAGRVASTIRAGDLLCRYGGEEFAVVMRECAEDEAVIFAERVRRLVEAQPCRAGDVELRLTVSLGVATAIGGRPETPEDLIAAADRYLYRAKETRNRVEASMLSGP